MIAIHSLLNYNLHVAPFCSIYSMEIADYLVSPGGKLSLFLETLTSPHCAFATLIFPNLSPRRSYFPQHATSSQEMSSPEYHPKAMDQSVQSLHKGDMKRIRQACANCRYVMPSGCETCSAMQELTSGHAAGARKYDVQGSDQLVHSAIETTAPVSTNPTQPLSPTIALSHRNRDHPPIT